MAPDNGWDSG
ncbi:hypothetical protein YPPY03_4630, partial [Yersinia pestis PY-03]